MLQLLSIIAGLVLLSSCSFFSSPIGQDIISGEEQVIETVIKDVIGSKK